MTIFIVNFILIFLLSYVKPEFEELVRELENKLWDTQIPSEVEASLYHSIHQFLQAHNNVNPPASQTYVEKIMAAGYNFEDHKVITKDDYILSLWRIPGKIDDPQKEGKKPIFFLHGLLDDAYTWIVLNPNNSLPMMLSDEGYDIWLGNCRGNIFSTEHRNREQYDSFQFYSNYWNFSLHEMALYDIPAMVDYIRNFTRFDKIFYIGHSQGTTTFYFNYMMNPQYLKDRIDKFVAVGNALTVFNTHSKFIKFFEYTWFFNFLDKIYIKNLFNMGTNINRLLHLICKNILPVCRYIINSVVATRSTNHMDYQQIINLFYYEPGGTSTKNLIHWIQLIRDKKLRYFDYGERLNRDYYNSSEPPSYNLEAMKRFDIKSLIIAGDCDSFTEKEDFDFFKGLVGSNNKYYKFLKNYNHLDYIWGKEAVEDIYRDVIDFINDKSN